MIKIYSVDKWSRIDYQCSQSQENEMKYTFNVNSNLLTDFRCVGCDYSVTRLTRHARVWSVRLKAVNFSCESASVCWRFSLSVFSSLLFARTRTRFLEHDDDRTLSGKHRWRCVDVGDQDTSVDWLTLAAASCWKAQRTVRITGFSHFLHSARASHFAPAPLWCSIKPRWPATQTSEHSLWHPSL